MATNIQDIASRVQPGRGPRTRGSPQTDTTSVDSKRSFAEELQQAGERELKLSGHARKRINQREISFDASDRQSVREAVLHLSGKGARDALLLRSDAAFLVNVPNRTVITAMDRAEMQERVFTDIDSAYLLDR